MSDAKSDNLGDEPVQVTRRVVAYRSDLAYQVRHTLRQHERQTREAGRPTGTELKQTSTQVQGAKDTAIAAQTAAQKALDKAESVAGLALESAKSADAARQSAEKAATDAQAAQGLAQQSSQDAQAAKAAATTAQSAASSAAADAKSAASAVDKQTLLLASRQVLVDMQAAWAVGSQWLTLARVSVPAVVGLGRVLVGVDVCGVAVAHGGAPLYVRLLADSQLVAASVAAYAGSTVLYPGAMTGERALSLSTSLEVAQGTELILQAMTSDPASYPQDTANSVRLSARLDYKEA